MGIRYLGREDPLEKVMTTRSSILAWRIPWTEEPGELVHGVTESDTAEVTQFTQGPLQRCLHLLPIPPNNCPHPGGNAPGSFGLRRQRKPGSRAKPESSAGETCSQASVLIPGFFLQDPGQLCNVCGSWSLCLQSENNNLSLNQSFHEMKQLMHIKCLGQYLICVCSKHHCYQPINSHTSDHEVWLFILLIYIWVYTINIYLRLGLFFFFSYYYVLKFWLCWVFIVLLRVFLLQTSGSEVHRLSSCPQVGQLLQGTWDLSSPTRDRTSAPCTGSQILNHWTTREVSGTKSFFNNFSFFITGLFSSSVLF